MRINNNDVICIICARGGSKGLPKKNLRRLGEQALICRPIRQAIDSGAVGTVLVTTDDHQIAELARSAGAVVPFMRPAELAQDLTTTEETLQHALLTYEQIVNREFEIGVFLTATDVFRETSWIGEAVTKLRQNPELESVFSGHATHKNYWEKDDDGNWVRIRPWMSNYSSRQIRKKIIREDTGIVCASRAWLWRDGRRIGDKVEIIVNDDPFTGIDIHTEEDLMLANSAFALRGISK